MQLEARQVPARAAVKRYEAEEAARVAAADAEALRVQLRELESTHTTTEAGFSAEAAEVRLRVCACLHRGPAVSADENHLGVWHCSETVL